MSFPVAGSEAARVVFTVERKSKGRKRFRRAGRFAQQGAKGKNAKRFSGKVGRRKLRPASYRATLVATDGAGNASRPRPRAVIRRFVLGAILPPW